MWIPAEERDEPRTPLRFKPWAALAVFALTLAIVLLWLDRTAGGDRLAGTDAMVENFERMALHGGALRVWETPLRIAVLGEGWEQFTPEVAQAAGTFRTLTGLDAQVAPHGAEAFNVLVTLVPPDEYGVVAARLGARNQGAEYLAEHTLCYTVSSISTNNARARRATVVIPHDLSSLQIEACIWHEMMHVFGFQAHPDARFASALRGSPRMTRNDMVLLRTLYDPRLGDGPPDEGVARARSLLAEHASTARAARDPLAALARR